MENLPPKKSHKTRIITNVLTTALKFWLKSQVSQVSQLDVEIKAGDRQLLSGRIPWVSINATNAVYKGIHVTQIQLAAENIQVNIGGILKGQPVKLLHIVPVVGNLIIEEKDINSSLGSELLSTALNDVVLKILPESCLKYQLISWEKITIGDHKILVVGIISSTSELTPIEISLNLELVNGHELKLENIQVRQNQVAMLENEHSFHIDLGSDIDIQELTLIPGKLVCQGKINVNP
ncbi:DUF2993 domain-containing protein [Nodularia chucula]|uniref:LmeA family phospholipid-binding protein n=1 Tax=Nodularia chucula TaxID=3093667 RepID=UPI0039C5C1AA